MIIIGLSGKKRSGKDTAADFIRDLAEAKGYQFKRFAFADAVKEECAQACGLPVEFMERHKDTFRVLYQWWGTELRRQFFGQDYWTVKVASQISQLSGSVVACITDVRFPDEVQCVESLGGQVLRLFRPGQPTDRHSSETALDDYRFRHVIVNSGSLDELKAGVAAFWAGLAADYKYLSKK